MYIYLLKYKFLVKFGMLLFTGILNSCYVLVLWPNLQLIQAYEKLDSLRQQQVLILESEIQHYKDYVSFLINLGIGISLMSLMMFIYFIFFDRINMFLDRAVESFSKLWRKCLKKSQH